MHVQQGSPPLHFRLRSLQGMQATRARFRFKVFGVLSGVSIPIWPQGKWMKVDVAGVAEIQLFHVGHLPRTRVLTQQLLGQWTAGNCLNLTG